MRLFLASSNRGKLRELSALARAEGFELETVPGYERVPRFPEDEASFALNAMEKALYYSGKVVLEGPPRRPSTALGVIEPRGSGVGAKQDEKQESPRPSGRGRWAEHPMRRADVGATGDEKFLVIADDSGLVVEALGGRPGVRSARYAGPEATDEENNRKLLEEMRGVPEEKRGARFVCVLALARGERVVGIFSDSVEGRIAEAPRGSGGFGYDPLFFLPERGCTTAELTPEEKNRVSHRGKAFVKLLRFVREANLATRE
jgi:XTP/dITP diphosphohydrolase